MSARTCAALGLPDSERGLAAKQVADNGPGVKHTFGVFLKGAPNDVLVALNRGGTAELYLVENVPFGTVTVCVPRNSRDPEAHALARARELVGVGEPEHIDVTDFSKRAESSENIKDDIYVELHFNGYYED